MRLLLIVLTALAFVACDGSPRAGRNPAGAQVIAEGASCIPREKCCRVCTTGQACGASCISQSYTCRKGRGCACNADEVCP